MMQKRRGIVVVAVVVLMLILDLIVVGIVISGARGHDVTVRRMDTIRAFYAAEAGANMSIRELREENDDDGDGVIGTVSFETPTYIPGDDPTFGPAKAYVSIDIAGSQTTLTSEGRSGDARRHVEAVLDTS